MQQQSSQTDTPKQPEGLTSRYCVIGDGEDSEDYVIEYPWRERYDPQKTYTREPFKARYGDDGVERTYRYEFYELGRRGAVSEKWIVVTEELSEAEQQALAPYCQCVACHVPWWAWERWSCASCACCVGCLHSPFAQQHQIDAARKAQAGQPRKQRRWTPLYESGIVYVGVAFLAVIAVGEFVK